MASLTRCLAPGLVLLLASCTAARPAPAPAPAPAPSATTLPSASTAHPTSPNPTSPSPASASPTFPSPPPETSKTSGLTPQQLAGQRVIYSYPGLTPPPTLLADIREGRAAGVIFFGENVSSPAQLSAVIGQLRQAQLESPIRVPLLLMTDQEGGLIRRLPGAPELSERQIGQQDAPVAAATDAGTSAGENLARLGLNVNLAPVLDVYDTPNNFIDHHQRSYSSSPTAVAALGRAFITAQQQTGVAATAKHFPGLGSAPAGPGTDGEPVTLASSPDRLRAVDEAPYVAAIAAGVKLVMLSWAVYPTLDGDHPAGLSPTVVGQELRGRLGYGGVTVTDGLEAGALHAVGSTGHRAVAAAAAGMDLLLCSSKDTGQGEDATEALATALTTGQLDRAVFTDAADRVTALRAGLH